MNRMINIIAVALLALSPVPALAHAMLDHASPKVGSSSPTAPHQVVLWFTENLEPAFSRIEVRNASGALVSSGKARLGAKNELRVALKALPPGTYKVIWRVLSVDTHRTQGDFSFRVGP
ncbi:MAG: copper resistance CopC family protein [Pseudolabrys sp.]